MIRTKLSLLCFLFLLAACGGNDTPATEPPVTPPEEPVNPPGEDEDTNLNANPADEAHPYVTDLCIPRLNEANQYVEHTVSYREQEILNYALEWVGDKRHAAWVAFSFDSETSQKNVNRTDEWLPDPFIPTSPQESDHKSDGFDKGHLCASDDRSYNRTANEQTFYYTNISPQMTSFNGGYWVTFEKLVQTWARSGTYDKLYVTKGGTTDDLLTNFTGTQHAADGRKPQPTDANPRQMPTD